MIFLALVLYVPFPGALFHFSTLHPNDIALYLAAGALQEELGLKVEARRKNVDTPVVDHAENTPTEKLSAVDISVMALPEQGAAKGNSAAAC